MAEGPAVTGGRRSRDRLVALTAALTAVLAVVGCAETIRPVLGGLRIGPPKDGPFVTPVLLAQEIPFDYPEDAWNRGVGGETLLRIHISSSGVIDSVALANSSGDSVLDSASVASAWRLRYRPARHGDNSVAVWALLPVRYPMPKAVQTENTEPL